MNSGVQFDIGFLFFVKIMGCQDDCRERSTQFMCFKIFGGYKNEIDKSKEHENAADKVEGVEA